MEQIEAHISGYLNFVQTTLQPRLQELLAAREAVEAEMGDYGKLCETLAAIRASSDAQYKSLVEVGSKCLMQAVVEEPKSVYVHIGAGFHTELEFDEAIELSNKRIEILQRRRDIAEQRAAECGAHIEQVMDTINQLRQLQQSGGWADIGDEDDESS